LDAQLVAGFEFATLMMRPEYRSQIDAKFKRKIEAIVRKPSKTEETERASECPYCRFLLPESALDCSNCKNNLPYCIVTGRHMVASDFSVCPYCRFPALHSMLKVRLAWGDGGCVLLQGE
jgi:WD repeat-containing protein 19